MALASAAGCGPGSSVDIGAFDGSPLPRDSNGAGAGGRGGTGGVGATGGAGASGVGGSGTGGTGETGGNGGAGGAMSMPDAPVVVDMAVDGPAPPRDVNSPPPPDMNVPPPPDMAPPPPRDMAPPSPDAPAGTNLAMGLISRYKFDEGMGTSTSDSAGNNNGTLGGGPMWIRPGFPMARYPNVAALHFDGSDDHVQVGNANMRRNNEAQSVAFWVRYAGPPADSRVCVSVTQGDAGAGRLKIGFNDGMVKVWKSSGDDLLSTATPPAGWHHYAYTYDGNTHRLYLDGTSRATSTTAPDNAPAVNVRIGAIYNNAENFEGDLDDVRFYSRALTPAEVMALSQGWE